MKLAFKTISLSFLFLIFLSENVLSQNKKEPTFSPLPSKEAAAELLKRPLVLCKREVDSKEAEKLAKKNPEQLKSMQTYNEYYNDAMKFYFESLYKGSKSIELKSKAEVDQLISSASPSVSVIVSGDQERVFKIDELKKTQDTYSFEMMLPDKKNEKLTISLLNNVLSDADFVFVIQQINNQLKNIIDGTPSPSYDYSNKNTASKLKNLKLIINPDRIEGGMTKEEVIKNYSLPFEYMDSIADYENIITEQAVGYAYIMPIWSSAMWGATFAMIDAGTGEILSVLSAGGVHYSIAAGMPKTVLEQETRFMSPREKRLYERKHMVEIIRFKKKYELKGGHLKRFAKLATEGD